MEGPSVRNRTSLDAALTRAQTAPLSAPIVAPGEEEMTKKTDEFARYSLAEKQLCDEAGPSLSQLIAKVERAHDVTINELRVTIERAKPEAPWGAVTCTIVR